MGTRHELIYGDRPVKVYPVSESELRTLKTSALMALTIVGIPILIVDVLLFVSRLRRETQFDECALSATDSDAK